MHVAHKLLQCVSFADYSVLVLLPKIQEKCIANAARQGNGINRHRINVQCSGTRDAPTMKKQLPALLCIPLCWQELCTEDTGTR